MPEIKNLWWLNKYFIINKQINFNSTTNFGITKLANTYLAVFKNINIQNILNIIIRLAIKCKNILSTFKC